MAPKTFTHKNKEQDPGCCQHVCLVKDKVDAGGMYSSQKNLQLMMTVTQARDSYSYLLQLSSVEFILQMTAISTWQTCRIP